MLSSAGGTRTLNEKRPLRRASCTALLSCLPRISGAHSLLRIHPVPYACKDDNDDLPQADPDKLLLKMTPHIAFGSRKLKSTLDDLPLMG